MLGTVEERQTPVDKLSTAIMTDEIDRQTQMPPEVAHHEIPTPRQLNAICDPVARFPFDISSEIFIQCLHSRPSPGALDAPMLFLNICHAWTDIALSTTKLWASIHVDRPLLHLASLLGAWFERAGSRALSISLLWTKHYLRLLRSGERSNLTDAIAAVISRHAQKIQELRIFYCEDDIELVAGAGPFPLLKTLTIDRGMALWEISSKVPIMGILRLCPNLVEFTFNGSICGNDKSTELLVLPHLRQLTFAVLEFGGIPWYITSDARFLQYISAPHLETLYSPPCSSGLDALIPFFRRSSPPLRMLSLGSLVTPLNWTGKETRECLSLLPNLAHLELVQCKPLTAQALVTILANSPEVVPNLSSISLSDADPGFPAPWYRRLLSTLLSRREEIKTVRVILDHRTVLDPPQNMLAALRQLVADGMSIHIGTERYNYV
ncbi:hypothetical protein B0H17DRAFT_1337569 [Mycena rosella]|uniref:F-box domain-containing protein n=1 Tax=Mycena rosella TaxID=1033263 RepID=A0AAD7G1X3_MYCRO|nr:hypothetical protein B0H17DRAFT_1337569 [Mycena rosella]